MLADASGEDVNMHDNPYVDLDEGEEQPLVPPEDAEDLATLLNTTEGRSQTAASSNAEPVAKCPMRPPLLNDAQGYSQSTASSNAAPVAKCPMPPPPPPRPVATLEQPTSSTPLRRTLAPLHKLPPGYGGWEDWNSSQAISEETEIAAQYFMHASIREPHPDFCGMWRGMHYDRESGRWVHKHRHELPEE
jgi:hypothetical protein